MLRFDEMKRCKWLGNCSSVKLGICLVGHATFHRLSLVVQCNAMPTVGIHSVCSYRLHATVYAVSFVGGCVSSSFCLSLGNQNVWLGGGA